MPFRRKFARDAYNVFVNIRNDMPHYGVAQIDVDIRLADIVTKASEAPVEGALQSNIGNPSEEHTFDFFGYVMKVAVDRTARVVRIVDIV